MDWITDSDTRSVYWFLFGQHLEHMNCRRDIDGRGVYFRNWAEPFEEGHHEVDCFPTAYRDTGDNQRYT